MVKVMTNDKPDYPIWGLAFNRYVCLLFCGNQTNFGWHIAKFQIWPWSPIPEIQFDLENSRPKVQVKVTLVSVASSWLISFCFTSTGPTIPKIWQIECSTGEKRIWNFTLKIAKKKFLREILQNLIRWITRGIYLRSFFNNWMFSLYHGDNVTVMGTKKSSHTHRLTMCGLKKLAWEVFPESWKVLAERRRWRWRLKRTKNNNFHGYPGGINNVETYQQNWLVPNCNKLWCFLCF